MNRKKKITNARKYIGKYYKLTDRSIIEETENKPRTIHKPRHKFGMENKEESVGYYGIRKLAFTLTQKEYRTPQHNLLLIAEFLKSKGIELSDNLGTYNANLFGIKLFPANAPANEYVLINVSTNGNNLIEYTEQTFLDKFSNYQSE